jgi:type II secretory pathway component PulL
MRKKLIGLAVVVTVAAGATSAALWHQQRQAREAAIRAASTTLFAWAPGDARGQLVLTVHHNPALGSIASVPPAPVDGELKITASTGTVPEGAVVQVLNPRSGQSSTTVAGADGSFELTAIVEGGDELRMVALELPEVLNPPSAAMAVQVVGE